MTYPFLRRSRGICNSAAVRLLLIFLLLSVTRSLKAAGPEFDGQSAFTFLYKQVKMGPRVPGSKAHAEAVSTFQDWFIKCGADVRLQTFDTEVHTQPDVTSSTRKVKGVNIIAHFGGKRDADYILCAHYDTRPWADEDKDPAYRDKPIPGANDGASGVGVLLEMARLFAQQPPPVPVEIVLFDVEDSGVPGSNTSFCKGSAYYATNRYGSTPAGAVLLDMIGQHNLEIRKESFSWTYAREWTDYLFKLAREAGSDAFVDEVGQAVYDDHVNLLEAGIPSCDLIDFDYPYWHTHEDVPEMCSAESLAQVGRMLVRLVYGP